MSRKKVAITILVIALVTIAGCMGGTGGNTTTTTTTTDAGDESNTSTQTDSEKTTSKPTLSSINLPGGVSTDSVTESKLLQAHADSLANSSYKSTISVAITSGVETDNPATFEQKHKIVGNIPEQKVKATTKRDDELARAKYIGSNAVYTKVFNQDGEDSYSVTERAPQTSELTGEFLYGVYLKGVDFQPDQVVMKDGELVIRLQAVGFDDRSLVKENLKATSAENVTGTALVKPSGRILSLDLGFEFKPEEGDGTNRLSVSTSTTSTKGDIMKPAWTQNAEDKSMSVDVQLTEDGYISISPQDAKLPKGTTIHFYLESTGQSKVTLDSAVDAGGTVYLYVKGGSGHLTISPPSDFTAVEQFSLAAVGPDGSELFRANG